MKDSLCLLEKYIYNITSMLNLLYAEKWMSGSRNVVHLSEFYDCENQVGRRDSIGTVCARG